MKFSFLTYQFCRFGLEHSFKMAQEYGFEGVEVWGGRPHAYAHDMGREEIQAILGWKKQYGVEISMFTPEILAYPYSLTSSMEKERRETIEYLLKSVETAARLGTCVGVPGRGGIHPVQEGRGTGSGHYPGIPVALGGEHHHLCG